MLLVEKHVLFAEPVQDLLKLMHENPEFRNGLKTLLRPEEQSGMSRKFFEKGVETVKQVLGDFEISDFRQHMVVANSSNVGFADLYVHDLGAEALEKIMRAGVLESGLTSVVEAKTRKSFDTTLVGENIGSLSEESETTSNQNNNNQNIIESEPKNDTPAQNPSNNTKMSSDINNTLKNDKNEESQSDSPVLDANLILEPSQIESFHHPIRSLSNPISISFIFNNNLEPEGNSNQSLLYEFNFSSLVDQANQAVVEIPLSMLLEIQNMVYEDTIDNSSKIFSPVFGYL